MSNWFCLSRRCLCCLRPDCGGLSQQSNNGESALLCVPWQNLDGDSFDMLYKSGCWAAIPDPMWVINIPHERKINMLSCTEISSVISFFSFEKFWVKPGLPSTQLNLANTQNLEKINFDMFYKNYCWAVICYPICVTNVSYKREVIVLSFPVISFVILILFFWDSILNLGFLFIDSHCIRGKYRIYAALI